MCGTETVDLFTVSMVQDILLLLLLHPFNGLFPGQPE